MSCLNFTDWNQSETCYLKSDRKFYPVSSLIITENYVLFILYFSKNDDFIWK